jgi:hypothetical protein
MLDSPPLDDSPTDYALEDLGSADCGLAEGTLVDRTLRPANDQEVVREMAYVLRSWPNARGRRRSNDALARITAERLVDYLHLSGFELVKRPMVTDTGYVGGNL